PTATAIPAPKRPRARSRARSTAPLPAASSHASSAGATAPRRSPPRGYGSSILRPVGNLVARIEFVARIELGRAAPLPPDVASLHPGYELCCARDTQWGVAHFLSHLPGGTVCGCRRRPCLVCWSAVQRIGSAVANVL